MVLHNSNRVWTGGAFVELSQSAGFSPPQVGWNDESTSQESTSQESTSQGLQGQLVKEQ